MNKQLVKKLKKILVDRGVNVEVEGPQFSWSSTYVRIIEGPWRRTVSSEAKAKTCELHPPLERFEKMRKELIFNPSPTLQGAALWWFAIVDHSKGDEEHILTVRIDGRFNKLGTPYFSITGDLDSWRWETSRVINTLAEAKAFARGSIL